MFSRGAGLRLIIAALAILIGLQILLVGVGAYLRAHEVGSPLRPVLVHQTVAAVNLIESLPGERRAKALAAINSPFIRYRLIESFPDAAVAGDPIPAFRPIINVYRAALGDRRFQVYRRQRSGDGVFGLRKRVISGDIIVVIKLDAGALIVEPHPDYRRQLLFNFAALLSSIIGVALLAALVWASLSATRPVRRMTAAAERLAGDLDAPPIVESGPEPVRRLARAFNKMQADLKHMVDQRTLTLAAVAHDFRTYLTRLRMRAEYIADDAQRAKAESDIEEMTALIDDTLAAAKAGTSRGDVEQIDLATLVADIADAQREVGRDVVFSRPPAPVIIAASPAGAKRAITNVIDNAVRYGTRACVDIAAEAGAVIVRVRDEGPGVPEAELQRLTDPFYRVDASRSRATGGSGLGLAIARSLVEASGGRIEFRNAPAGGLEATIIFTTAEAP